MQHISVNLLGRRRPWRLHHDAVRVAATATAATHRLHLLLESGSAPGCALDALAAGPLLAVAPSPLVTPLVRGATSLTLAKVRRRLKQCTTQWWLIKNPEDTPFYVNLGPAHFGNGGARV